MAFFGPPVPPQALAEAADALEAAWRQHYARP